MNQAFSRRTFMASSFTAVSASRVLGANERIRLGIIGVGSRGSYHIKEVNKAGNVQWVAVCDAWDERRTQATLLTGTGVEHYADYRHVLDRKDVDGVIVSTWENTHSQITIDACRAGKDVYVEKVMTSTPEQGPPLVRVVRETRRIVQVGVQQRSTPHFIEAKERFVNSGRLGPVHMVRTNWNNNVGFLFKPPAGLERKPSGLDWEACLGTLPKIPWDPKRYFNRFAYLELCGGQIGGLLVHMVDVVQWYLGISKPLSAVALGGIYQFDDGRDSPDNVNVVLEYAEKLTVTFEASLTDGVPLGNSDIVFMGEGGRLSIFRQGYRFFQKGKKDSGEVVTAPQGSSYGPPDDHMKNWFDSMRSRKEPNATVEQGHYAAMACHMGNLAWLKKARVPWRKEWDI